jgi:hypothetical protein
MNPSPTNSDIFIISGLPRSGTSLAMQLVQAAGIVPFTDESRPADTHNQKGYFESSKVLTLPRDSSWLWEAEGKAVKVISALLRFLPSGYRYKIIFMERSIDEVVSSQRRMLEGLGKTGAGIPAAQLAAIFHKELDTLKTWLDSRNDFDVLRISYNRLMHAPMAVLPQLLHFVNSNVKPEELIRVIDPELYRSKSD